MQSYSVRENFLRSQDQELLSKIEYIFDKLPERTLTSKVGIPYITCHHLTHALANNFSQLQAVDGWFGNRLREHSRLEEIIGEEKIYIERNRLGNTIIDPYPIGGIKPQMYYGYRDGPRKKIYIAATTEERKKIHEGLLISPEFKKQVKLIQKDIQKILKNM